MKTEHEMRMISICRALYELHNREIEKAKLNRDFLWFWMLTDSKRNLPRVMRLIPDSVIVPEVTKEGVAAINDCDSIGSLMRSIE